MRRKYSTTSSLKRVSRIFFFSSRRRHTRLTCDWSSDVCSSDLRVEDEAGRVANVLLRPHPRRPDHERATAARKVTPRGLTVLELMVVVGIAAVLAAMSAGAYDQITSRADFSSVVGNLVTSVRLTRSEAAGRGVATAFVVDTRNNRWWGVEAPTGWSLAAFDPTAPGTLIASDTFPTGSGKAVFGPAAGYGGRLPAPFASVPVITSQAPTFPYCSFCDRDTGMG